MSAADVESAKPAFPGSGSKVSHDLEVALYLALAKAMTRDSGYFSKASGSKSSVFNLPAPNELKDPSAIAKVLGLTPVPRLGATQSFNASAKPEDTVDAYERSRSMQYTKTVLDKGGVAFLKTQDEKWMSVVGVVSNEEEKGYRVLDPTNGLETVYPLSNPHEVQTFATPWSEKMFS